MLKLTTDKHKASRGLSATAELLVINCSGIADRYFLEYYNYCITSAITAIVIGNYLLACLCSLFSRNPDNKLQTKNLTAPRKRKPPPRPKSHRG